MQDDMLLRGDAHEARGAEREEDEPDEADAVRERGPDALLQRGREGRDERDRAVRDVVARRDAREELDGQAARELVLEDRR